VIALPNINIAEGVNVSIMNAGMCNEANKRAGSNDAKAYYLGS
jgi:hypothetical protein